MAAISADVGEEYLVEAGDLSIRFPLPPYPSQAEYARRLASSLAQSGHAVLESPTGSGKTLAMLSTALAWLRQPGGGVTKRVFFASRTHAQLAQAVAQLRNACRELKVPVAAVTLGSRDNLCAHPKVRERATQAEKNQHCRFLVKAGRCEFYNNYSNRAGNNSAGGCSSGEDLNEVLDVEDLVKDGQRKRACPYYQSRDLAASASIVFLPYNYLLDGRIRSSLPVSLQGALILVDEAHNAPQVCEDVSSCALSLRDVAAVVSDADAVIKVLQNDDTSALAAEALPEGLTLVDVAEVKEFAVRLESRLETLLREEQKQGQPWSGEKILETLAMAAWGENGCGIQMSQLSSAFTKLLEAFGALESLGAKGVGRGTAALSTFFDQAMAVDRRALKDDYRLHRDKTSGGGGSFSLWCFTPAVAWLSLLKCMPRTVVLTSGTLQPVADFAARFAVPFAEVWTASSHVVPQSRVLVRVVQRGPAAPGAVGEPLDSSYRNRSNPKYTYALGSAIVSVLSATPSGVLIFFPSYAALDGAVSSWKCDGQWTRMTKEKQGFVEPKDKRDFPMIIKNFDKAAAAGAFLVAVCRGKVSEGMDFTDEMARAVIAVGLPFPNVRDNRVKEKMAHEDVATGGGAGSRWYRLQAYRAVNQAVGRVIRSAKDYGAVFFLDRRFADHEVKQNLTNWVAEGLKEDNDWWAVVRDTRAFFSRNAAETKREDGVKGAEKAKAASSGMVMAKQSSSVDRPSRQPPPVAKRRRIVVASTNSQDVLRSKATNVVSELKASLVKEHLAELKATLRAYKTSSRVDDLVQSLRTLRQSGAAIKASHLHGLREFVRGQDHTAFDDFLAAVAAEEL